MSGSVISGLDSRYWRPGAEPATPIPLQHNTGLAPVGRVHVPYAAAQQLNAAKTLEWSTADWTVVIRGKTESWSGSDYQCFFHAMSGGLYFAQISGNLGMGVAGYGPDAAFGPLPANYAEAGVDYTVVLRATGATAQAWWNGVLIGTLAPGWRGWGTWHSGAAVAGFGWTRAAAIAECAVWARALTDTEVKAATGVWLPTMNDSSLKGHYVPESVRADGRWCDISPSYADMLPQVGASHTVNPVAEPIVRSIQVTIQNTTIPGFLGTGSAALDLGDYAANLRAGDKLEVRTTGLPTDLEIDYAVCSVNGAASVRLINLSGSELASGNVAATLVHTIV